MCVYLYVVPMTILSGFVVVSFKLIKSTYNQKAFHAFSELTIGYEKTDKLK